jgi:hypothetical protein
MHLEVLRKLEKRPASESRHPQRHGRRFPPRTRLRPHRENYLQPGSTPDRIGPSFSRASSIELPILRLLARLSKGCERDVGKGCRCQMKDVRELPDCVEVAADAAREKIFFTACAREWKNCLSTRVPNGARVFARQFAVIFTCGKFTCAMRSNFTWHLLEENVRKLLGDPTFRSQCCDTWRRRARLPYRQPRRSAPPSRRGPATAHIA